MGACVSTPAATLATVSKKEAADENLGEAVLGWNDLFNRFEEQGDEITKLQNDAVNEVVTLDEAQWDNRRTWWDAYGEVHGRTGLQLLPFFKAWLLYLPEPCGDLESPSAEKPFGVADSPGYFIERWDWVANTENGLKLQIDSGKWRRWFRDFMNLRGDYLNQRVTWPEPLSNRWHAFPGDSLHPFTIKDYVEPTGGYTSFAHFFLRWVKSLEKQRPCEVDDPWAISAPADGGIFYLAKDTAPDGRFELPGKSGDTFNLIDCFPDGYGKKFVGGPLLDTLLWFTDFHHFFAPVGGEVVYMHQFKGSYNYDFDDYDDDDTDSIKPPSTSDRVGWYKALGKHHRQIWVIKTENMGFVGMCAVGFWGVGSIVTKDTDRALWAGGEPAPVVKVGSVVKKGDYLGHFGYGGSSIVLAFEPYVTQGKDLVYDFTSAGTIADPDHPLLVSARQTVGRVSIEVVEAKNPAGGE